MMTSVRRELVAKMIWFDTHLHREWPDGLCFSDENRFFGLVCYCGAEERDLVQTMSSAWNGCVTWFDETDGKEFAKASFGRLFSKSVYYPWGCASSPHSLAEEKPVKRPLRVVNGSRFRISRVGLGWSYQYHPTTDLIRWSSTSREVYPQGGQMTFSYRDPAEEAVLVQPERNQQTNECPVRQPSCVKSTKPNWVSREWNELEKQAKNKKQRL